MIPVAMQIWYSSRVLRIVFVWPCLLGIALSTSEAKDWPPTYFNSPCTCEGNHGEDRWEAKTAWSPIPSDPRRFRHVTPSKMYSWQPLPNINDGSLREAPEEEQWYWVTGRVVEVRAQADGDIHFALGDVTGREQGLILAEVPVGRKWCPLRTVVFGWTKKGAKFKRFKAPTGALALQMNPIVIVVGKAFFDGHHAGKSPLTNRNTTHKTGDLAAWEIHPVEDIRSEVRRAIPVRQSQVVH